MLVKTLTFYFQRISLLDFKKSRGGKNNNKKK